MVVVTHFTDDRSAARPPLGVRVARLLSRLRADVPLAVLDAAMTVVAYGSILVLRFDGTIPDGYWARFAVFAPLAVCVQLTTNWMWHLYGQIWTHASVREARQILLAGVSACAVLSLVSYTSPYHMPISVLVLGAAMTAMLSGAVRFQSRLFAVRRRPESNTRLAVIGAGQAGGAIVREMLRDHEGGLHPVAIFDDDPRKQDRSVLGVPVLGGIDAIPALARRLRIDQVLLAVARADADLVARAADAAAAADVPLKVLPGFAELVRGTVSIRDVRDLRIEDLLGRKEVKTDLEAVRSLLAGARVLITGAGGSIGGEIARQIAECGPRALVLLDHDETHLHDVAAELPDSVQVLADICDLPELEAAFARYRPEIVFHAAAHKHVPILEAHPCQASRTNVGGTQNVVAAATTFGARRLVFISTDKAVRPTSVMGASKWLGEQIVLGSAPEGSCHCAVRFGNVLGSRGSVLGTFARQIAAGGPVTVTDGRMSRYFMSVREAVQLVLQGATMATGGEIFMLDMGEPVNILGLAKRMIRLSGNSVGSGIPISITRARPGEKITEELQGPGEHAEPTTHPAITRLGPVNLSELELVEALEALDTATRLHRDDEALGIMLGLVRRPVPVGGYPGVAPAPASAEGGILAWSPSST